VDGRRRAVAQCSGCCRTNLRIDPEYQPQHRLYFCAHKRTVHQENLVGKVANLANTLLDENLVPFVYAGYVSGDYLDETVNAERTEFQMPKTEDVLGDPSWDSLLAQSAGQAASYLSSYTASKIRCVPLETDTWVV
jgi:hypothetical protein